MKKIILFFLLAVVLVACADKNKGGNEPTTVKETYQAEYEGVTQTVTLTRNKAKNDRIEKINIDMVVPPSASEGVGTHKIDMVIVYTGDNATKIDTSVLVPGSSNPEKGFIDDSKVIADILKAANKRDFLANIEEDIEPLYKEESYQITDVFTQRITLSINKEESDRIEIIKIEEDSAGNPKIDLEIIYDGSNPTKINRTITKDGPDEPQKDEITDSTKITEILQQANARQFIKYNN